MAFTPVIIGPEAADQLREVVQRVLSENINTFANGKTSGADYSFFALPMCGTEIPAATDSSHPGSAMCCLFVLQPVSAADPDGAKQLVPVKDGSTPYKVRVYNTFSLSAVDCNYIPVTLSDDGSFILVSKPENDCDHDDVPGSGTTRAPTTTTPRPGSTTTTRSATTTSSLCSGRSQCKFIWGHSSKKWTKEFGCEVTTSTTAAPTTTGATTTPIGGTSSSTTSTTTTCACANPDAGTTASPTTTAAPTSTSSTSSSSTSGGGGTTTTSSSTTTRACDCEWPTFCGTTDGQCTITRCSKLETTEPKCGQTTTSTTTSGGGTTTSSGTTTCNCATTTTTDGSTTSSTGTTIDPNDPANDCAGCGRSREGYGVVTYVNNCRGECYCPAWVFTQGAPPCSSAFFACLKPGTGGGSPPPPCQCDGGCGWQSSGNGWSLLWNECEGNCGCHCEPPDSPPVACGSAVTPCGINR